MAIVANLTTISLDASPIGNITSFSAPEDAVKEVDVTTLSSVIEEYQASTLEIAGEFSFTIHADSADLPQKGDAGEWVITLPDSTTWTFSGFVRSVGAVDGDASSEDALSSTITIRRTTVITRA